MVRVFFIGLSLMIEQAMLVALGFALCGLLAIALLPAFWRRAMRLSARRVQMQVPLSLDEILAERDLLRAEFAIVQRRLEQRLETLVTRQAKDMSALGRSQAQLALSQQQYEATASQLAERDQHLAQALEKLEALSTQLAEVQALREQLDNQLQSQTKQGQAMERAYQSLSDIAEERRALIASLETRLSGLEMQLIDAAAPILPRSLKVHAAPDQLGGEEPALADHKGQPAPGSLSSPLSSSLSSVAALANRETAPKAAPSTTDINAQKAPN
jgi:hypothetical protein